MYLSVIIPTRNRWDRLLKLLNSILVQSYPKNKFEVIVVDNGSTDKTRQICDEFRKQPLHFRYIFEHRLGLHMGRHAGLHHARGDILVYADDDIEAFPHWLEGIADTFLDPRVMLGGGKNLPKFEIPPPIWLKKLWRGGQTAGKSLGYLSITDLNDQKKRIDPHLIFGCNFSVRKRIVLEAGGFHPDSMPEELIRYRGDGETYISDFVFQKGYHAVYNPKASVYHWIPKERMQKKYFCKRSYNQGISDSYTFIRKHRKYMLLLSVWAGRQVLKLISYDRLKMKFHICYIKGFLYHQNEVRKDPLLYQWVTKLSYIEES